MTDPIIRQADDVRHEVAAVASSTSKERALKFIKDVGLSTKTNAYQSYAELVADPSVDIVYVATPHSHHFQNALLALQAKKHVLCEKPFTVTSAQAKVLVEAARENQLFLMEAVWTRFLPISHQIREIVTSGKIGNVYRIIGANFCLSPNHRLSF